MLDTVSSILGWGLIFQQALFVDPALVNESFLWLAGGLLGVPGAAEVVGRIRGGTAGSVSPPASSESASSSSSTSPSGADLP